MNGHDAFEISKALSRGQVAGLRAVVGSGKKGVLETSRKQYAHHRLEAHEFGRLKAMQGGEGRPKGPVWTGPQNRQTAKKQLRLARGGPLDPGQEKKPVGMRGSLMRRGLP